MQNTLLHGTPLTLSRGGRPLLDVPAFTIGGGHILLLTGPNGCGKTSLLRLMAGLLPAPSPVAQARFCYLSATALPPSRQSVALWLAQQRALQGYTALSGAPTGDPFGITPFLGRALGSLSTGWRQRVKLSLLADEPASTRPLWLLDEPTGGLDAAGVSRFCETLGAHLAAGGACVMATHQPDLWPNAPYWHVPALKSRPVAEAA